MNEILMSVEEIYDLAKSILLINVCTSTYTLVVGTYCIL